MEVIMDSKHWMDAYRIRYVAHTYARLPRSFGERERGPGSGIWMAKEYLDFVSGLAVCNLGHCHPKVVKAIQDQAEKLIHVSNFYYIEPQIQLGLPSLSSIHLPESLLLQQRR